MFGYTVHRCSKKKIESRRYRGLDKEYLGTEKGINLLLKRLNANRYFKKGNPYSEHELWEGSWQNKYKPLFIK